MRTRSLPLLAPAITSVSPSGLIGLKWRSTILISLTIRLVASGPMWPCKGTAPLFFFKSTPPFKQVANAEVCSMICANWPKPLSILNLQWTWS